MAAEWQDIRKRTLVFSATHFTVCTVTLRCPLCLVQAITLSSFLLKIWCEISLLIFRQWFSLKGKHLTVSSSVWMRPNSDWIIRYLSDVAATAEKNHLGGFAEAVTGGLAGLGLLGGRCLGKGAFDFVWECICRICHGVKFVSARLRSIANCNSCSSDMSA